VRRLQGREPDTLRVLVKPELAGYTEASPLATEPLLVETLVDLLHYRGYGNVAIAATSDNSALWAENRDVYALTDLLGYRFAKPQGRAYEIVDLADAPDDAMFPLGSALHGTGMSRAWVDADVRIVFGKNRTDEESGYALALETLIGVLPLADKTTHYRRRRHSGDVAAALLAVAPVDFVLIDAITSAHGAGGRRSPEPIDTGTLIAASDIVLADYIGALKMGLDPAVSPTLALVVRSHPLPARHTVEGSLAPYAGWRNVPVAALRSTQARAGAAVLDRLVEPWLQCLDAELFPLKNPLDARLNATLADFFADDDSPTVQWLLMAASLLFGLVGQIVESYRTLFDKGGLHRRAVPLGIDVASLDERTFDELVDELIRLEPIAASAPTMSEGLRWRYVEGAVVFRYDRTLPIDFDRFVQCVDVARTIQFMNDYLGGVVVPIAYDAAGRPVTQAERNIYLPQPNYLVLYQGQPIDVSKLELVEYRPDRHRLYWKTIDSENGSAVSDDGIATFARTADGTCITITGRQLFTLPLFWQVFDLNLVPDIKSALVTHAYRTFFDRTLANFEAVVEGRDIRLGRPVDEPAANTAEQLVALLSRVGEFAAPLMQGLTQRPASVPSADHREVDADGFVHVRPASQSQPHVSADPSDLDRWLAEIVQFTLGLQRAAQRDAMQASGFA
jgi:uncharacterized protein (DUF362 family)